MAKKFLVDLDLTKNQILNIVLHNLAAAPSAPKDGQIYYNTTDKLIYFWKITNSPNPGDGVWVPLNGDITDVVAGQGLVGGGSSGSVTLDVNVDNTTLEISSDAVRVKDLGISTGKLADGAVTTIKITDKNVTFAKIQDIATMTVIGRVSPGTGSAEQISIINDDTFNSASATNIATAGSIKAFVDARIAAIGNLEGGFAAGSATDFPVGLNGTRKGDYWYVTSPGTVRGVILNIGDVLVATKDAASVTDPADWIFLESNRDQATETVKGVAEIATQVEVDAGTDDERIVTPLKLKTHLDARVGGFAANVGNGTNTSFVLTHGLNTRDVIISVYDNATYEEVITDVAVTTTTTVTVTFAAAPSSNAYRVVIKK